MVIRSDGGVSTTQSDEFGIRAPTRENEEIDYATVKTQIGGEASERNFWGRASWDVIFAFFGFDSQFVMKLDIRSPSGSAHYLRRDRRLQRQRSLRHRSRHLHRRPWRSSLAEQVNIHC